jgi:hypothetical protein
MENFNELSRRGLKKKAERTKGGLVISGLEAHEKYILRPGSGEYQQSRPLVLGVQWTPCLSGKSLGSLGIGGDTCWTT